MAELTVTLMVADPAAAFAVWDAILTPLGWTRVAELVDEEEDDAAVEALGWSPDDGPARLWVVAAGDSPPTTGLHLRLPAASRGAVEDWHAAAVAGGAVSRSAPRRWTPYRRGEFAATVADRAGNEVEAVGPE